jgi:hypothetical protein
MAKADQKQMYMKLDVRHEPFRKILFCNRFAIEREGGNRLVVFLFQSATGEIYDTYAVVLTFQDMESLKENWLDYLGKIGMPPSEGQNYQVNLRSLPFRGTAVETSNFIRLGRVGEIAEFRFFNFPISRMLDKGDIAPPDSGVETIPLALIRCDLNLQIQFLATFFDNALENQ